MDKRVALLGIYHESNTFLRTRTSLKEFESGHFLFGASIREEYEKAFHEIGGMLEVLDDTDIEVVPLVFAEATPGGMITDETLRHLFKEIAGALTSQGPFDGIMVAAHGAAVAESYPDMDGWWLQELRLLAGKQKPIIGTLDPHANVSQRMIDATDALVAYQTNPHVDQRETGKRAARLMVDTLKGAIKPKQYFSQPRAIISIEQQYTSGSPCKELFALARQTEKEHENILAISVMLGFPYADVNEMGSGFIVVTDDDEPLAQSAATALGDYFWKRRSDFVGEKVPVHDAVGSIARQEKPVLLLDMGDNVGGGSPGDSTFILAELERVGKWKSFVCLYDPEAVKKLSERRVGERVVIETGGKTDRLHGDTYRVEVELKAVADGVFKEDQPRHGGQVNYNMGKIAIVETGQGTTIMLTSLRIVPFSLNQLTSFGIEPRNYDVIVAKGVHAPMAAYANVCKTFVWVNTGGITQADVTRLPFVNRRKPLYPFEVEV